MYQPAPVVGVGTEKAIGQRDRTATVDLSEVGFAVEGCGSGCLWG